MKRLVTALVALVALVPVGLAHAAPAGPKPLRIADPVGDSTSADRGHDLTALTFSTGPRGSAYRQLKVRLESAAPFPATEALQEVTFLAGDCSYRLSHSAPSRTETAGSPVGTTSMTYDCGPASERFLGLGLDLPLNDVVTAARSITWTLDLDHRSVLAPGATLRGLTAYSSFDIEHVVWAPNTGGALTHDTLTSALTYRFG